MTSPTKMSDSDCSTSLLSTSSSDSPCFPPSRVLPSYFLCPITGEIMVDPVMDGEGNTFERGAILRWLVLYGVSPVSGRPVGLEELTGDRLVRAAISKAGKDSWARYEDDTIVMEEESETLPIKSRRRQRREGFDISSVDGTPKPAAPFSKSIAVPRGEFIGSNESACSNITFGLPHNGWAVQLGVHKIVCSPPGLLVTTDIHRRSNPVQRKHVDINGKDSPKELILPPNSYVEILETRVHGGRVRGRIAWEEDGIESPEKRKKKRIFRRKKEKEVVEVPGVHYGWISLQRAEEEESTLEEPGSNRGTGDSDGDEGPWTEPIPLGVYRIHFGAGLPLRQTPERDSTLLAKLEKGRCVEVVETRIGGDRVRARCIVPGYGSGWISLLNAVTGAKGARPVPLGAYVAVAESGCVVTEGGRLDSRVKGKLGPGTCIEVVATRIEEGVVRGLIAAGGYVTLFCPSEREEARMFAMPVPLGTYQVIQNGLEVTTGISSSSPVCVKLKIDACAEIIETRVEDGRVRGRMVAVGYGGVSKEANGWINLFEPTCRWAKIVCFQGGRPIAPQG